VDCSSSPCRSQVKCTWLRNLQMSNCEWTVQRQQESQRRKPIFRAAAGWHPGKAAGVRSPRIGPRTASQRRHIWSMANIRELPAMLRNLYGKEPQTHWSWKEEKKERLHVEDRTTNVNATGLPTDITVEAFIQLLTWHDYEIPGQNLWSSFTKINHRNLKADGLCSYLKRDSGLCNNAFGWRSN